jgi:hypothetical protein
MSEHKTVGVGFDKVKKIALELPGVTEGVTHSSPSFYIGKKFMGVLGEGDILIMKSAIVERDLLVQLEPDKYFITDHYVPFDYVLVRLEKVNEDEVRDLFRKAWRRLALKKLVKAHPEI